MRLKIRDIYPHLSELDEYSLAVAACLHDTYPQWMIYATVAAFHERNYLEIGVPAPLPMPEAAFQQDMVIQTSNEEITVAFGGMHSHFGSKFYEAFGKVTSLEDAWADAQAFIEDLMAERKIVTISVNSWGGCHAPDDERYPFLPDYPAPTYTRSWLGTYNRVYDSDKKINILISKINIDNTSLSS